MGLFDCVALAILRCIHIFVIGLLFCVGLFYLLCFGFCVALMFLSCIDVLRRVLSLCVWSMIMFLVDLLSWVHSFALR